MPPINTTSKDEIEQFIVNNEDLNEIESHLNRFNPIRVMKMERMEIRHSSILAWLLNPRENHGLNDLFLRRFLAEALKGSGHELSALEVANANLSDANVYVEWHHIDIFIECPEKGWAFVIENKVDSFQHSNQLEKYRNLVKKRFEKYKIVCLFLTLSGEEPDDNEYLPVNYRDVLPLLSLVLKSHQDTLSDSVYSFIEYYTEILGELCGMNDDDKKMQALARKVYQKNKKVIDFIMEHGASTEFQFSVQQLLDAEEDPGWGREFDYSGTKYCYFGQSTSAFSFLPVLWMKAMGGVSHDQNGKFSENDTYSWGGCQNWWSQYPIICWFNLTEKAEGKGSLRLFSEVGPLKEYKQRLSLIEAIEDSFCDSKLVSFNAKSKGNGTKYSKFLDIKYFSEAVDDVQSSESIKAAMDLILDKFSGEVVNPLNDALIKFKQSVE